MLETRTLTATVQSIRVVAGITEKKFLDIGKTLETSIAVLSGLIESFDHVLLDLKREDLRQALKALGRAAGHIGELGGTRTSEAESFDRLRLVAEAIATRLAKLNRSARTADSLAVSSKIAAGHINTSGADFANFANEVARTLDLTRASLGSFESKLQTVRNSAVTAHAEQNAFKAHREAFAKSIEHRLTTAVNTIAEQQQRAARASAEVKRRSELIRQQIGTAVMALQIGDATRQRIEHVDFGLGLLPGGSNAAANGSGQSGTPAFVAANYRLQSAQLSDTALEYSTNVRQVADSLANLATEAHTLRRVGNEAYGGSDREGHASIHEVETRVAEALSLFKEFGTAQAEAARVAASVSEATVSLCGHLNEVQSLEADIRIMGLNTTLRCSRLGPEGLPLNLIAQELRSYANEFAKEANALVPEVANVAAIANALRARSEADVEAQIAELADGMETALSPLRAVGEMLGNTVAAMERESVRIAGLFADAAAAIGIEDEIGQALRQAAGGLAAMVPSDEACTEDLMPDDEELFDLIARGYTMASERLVHERSLGRPCAAAPAPQASAEAELEDMLF